MKILITGPGVALLQICRQNGELPKWNTLHLSEADALRAIQLCIGERMKQVKMGQHTFDPALTGEGGTKWPPPPPAISETKLSRLAWRRSKALVETHLIHAKHFRIEVMMSGESQVNGHNTVFTI